MVLNRHWISCNSFRDMTSSSFRKITSFIFHMIELLIVHTGAATLVFSLVFIFRLKRGPSSKTRELLSWLGPAELLRELFLLEIA